MTVTWPTAQVMGQDLALVSLDDAVEWLARDEDIDRFSFVVTANLAHLDLLHTDAGFYSAYQRARARLIDGAPVVWLLRLWRHKVPGRVAGADIVGPTLKEISARHGSVAIFGGVPGHERRIENALSDLYPGLSRCTVISPPMGFSPTSAQAAWYAEHLAENCQDVDILFVCVGAPKQEIFASIWAERLPPVKALCCGAAIEMLINDVRRAPHLMQRVGLEWLYRLSREPRRLHVRYARSALVLARLLVRGRSRRR